MTDTSPEDLINLVLKSRPEVIVVDIRAICLMWEGKRLIVPQKLWTQFLLWAGQTTYKYTYTISFQEGRAKSLCGVPVVYAV